MRELKFRAWHKTIKQIMPVYEIHWKKKKIVTNKGFIAFNENVELMQYTGLKDKKGTEIYEGDIIRNLHGDLAEIRWHKMGFTTYSITKLFRVPFLKDVEYEVIGNIYER